MFEASIPKNEMWCGCWPDIKFKTELEYLKHMKQYHKDWYFSQLSRVLQLKWNTYFEVEILAYNRNSTEFKMSDTLKPLYEFTAHVGKCKECEEKQEQINILIKQIQNHILGGN